MPRHGMIAVVIVLIGALPARAAASSAPHPFLTGLAFPTNLAWTPDGRLFYTEKDTGNVRIVQDGKLLPQPFVHLSVEAGGETGLLGIALDPSFARTPWVYLYYSDASLHRNRLVRFLAAGNTASQEQVLLDAIETVRGIHNGGDMVFGSDGKLYVVLGETAQPDRAQDPNDLGGKVLRLNPNGTIPADNPFGPGNPAYSMGHRNSFGLCVDQGNGDLWETENGPSSDDEVNLIRAGGNYGWPQQLGPGGTSKGFVDPVLDYPSEIVPTGCAIWNGSLYFGSYRDGVLRRLALPPGPDPHDEAVAQLPASIIDVSVGPDDALYVSTLDSIWRIASPPTRAIATVSPVPGPSETSKHLAATGVIVAALVGLALLRVRALRRRS